MLKIVVTFGRVAWQAMKLCDRNSALAAGSSLILTTASSA